ncbi:MAG: hypothetical protein AB9872_04290 [Solidesulfovibrio sp.]
MTAFETAWQVPALPLIPHRPPMALVESLERADENGAVIRSCVGAGSMFARPDGTVEPLALLEIIAQACAAYGGWRTRKSGETSMAAFLAGVRSFETIGKAEAGRAMTIEVMPTREFGGFRLFEGILHQDGRQVARASIKAYHPPKDATDT